MAIINKDMVDKAFNELYEKYYLSIYKFSRAKLNNDTENALDCTQETFLVLYKKLSEGENFENPRAFLYSTCLNFIKKKYNEIKRRNDKFLSIDCVENIMSVDFDKKVISKINYSEFEKELNFLLTDTEKELYNLRYIKGLRVKDIAEIYCIDERFCSVKLSRLRKKIVSNLSEYF